MPQIAIFKSDDIYCGVETKSINTIIRYENIKRMPDIPDYIEGTVSWRGNDIKVASINKLFGKPDAIITKNTAIIIINSDEEMLGFMVEHVTEIRSFDSKDIEMTPDIIRKTGITSITGIVKAPDRLIPVIDLNEVLAQGMVIH